LHEHHLLLLHVFDTLKLIVDGLFNGIVAIFVLLGEKFPHQVTLVSPVSDVTINLIPDDLVHLMLMFKVKCLKMVLCFPSIIQDDVYLVAEGFLFLLLSLINFFYSFLSLLVFLV
jgi:hypothetical protein